MSGQNDSGKVLVIGGGSDIQNLKALVECELKKLTLHAPVVEVRANVTDAIGMLAEKKRERAIQLNFILFLLSASAEKDIPRLAQLKEAFPGAPVVCWVRDRRYTADAVAKLNGSIVQHLVYDGFDFNVFRRYLPKSVRISLLAKPAN